MRRFISVLALSVVAFGAACSDSSPTNGNQSGSAFDVTISAGLRPTYTWPGGTAHSLSVVRVSAPTVIVWGVAHVQQQLPSPVTHGTVSNGAIASATTETQLTAGVRYRVSITRADTKTGFTEFTP